MVDFRKKYGGIFLVIINDVVYTIYCYPAWIMARLKSTMEWLKSTMEWVF